MATAVMGAPELSRARKADELPDTTPSDSCCASSRKRWPRRIVRLVGVVSRRSGVGTSRRECRRAREELSFLAEVFFQTCKFITFLWGSSTEGKAKAKAKAKALVLKSVCLADHVVVSSSLPTLSLLQARVLENIKP